MLALAFPVIAQTPDFSRQWTPLGVGGDSSAQGLNADITTDIGLVDLDGDGDRDAVVVNDSVVDADFVTGQSYVCINAGNGVFDRIRFFGSGQDKAAALVHGDFNGDGLADIAVGCLRTGEACDIFLNDQGTLVRHAAIGDAGNNAESAGISSLAVGDVNGDGALDLVLGFAEAMRIEVWLGSGTGTFTFHQQVEVADLAMGSSDAGVRGLALGDMDGDGALDLAATVAPGLIFFNVGGHYHPVHARRFDDSATAWRTAHIADLDGDGRLDLAMGASTGTGNQLLQARRYNPWSADWTVLIDLSGGIGLLREVCDIDNDGDMDLVTAGVDHLTASRVYFNQGNGSVLDAQSQLPLFVELEIKNWTSNAIASGDCDGDGDVDLALGRGRIGASMQNVVLLNDARSADATSIATALDDIAAVSALGRQRLWTFSLADGQGPDGMATTLTRLEVNATLANPNTIGPIVFERVEAWSLAGTAYPEFVAAPDQRLPAFREGMRVAVSQSQKYNSASVTGGTFTVASITNQRIRIKERQFLGTDIGVLSFPVVLSLDDFSWTLEVEGQTQVSVAPVMVDARAGRLVWYLNQELVATGVAQRFGIEASLNASSELRSLIDNTTVSLSLRGINAIGSHFPIATNPIQGVLAKTTPVAIRVEASTLRIVDVPASLSVNQPFEMLVEYSDVEGNRDWDVQAPNAVTARYAGALLGVATPDDGVAVFGGATALVLSGPLTDAAVIELSDESTGGLLLADPSVLSAPLALVAGGTPVISRVEPTQGLAQGGDKVYLFGSGMGAAVGVDFGGVPAASFTVEHDHLIVAVTPRMATAPGTVNITVTGASQSTTVEDAYTLYPCTVRPWAGWNSPDGGISPNISKYPSWNALLTIRGEGFTTAADMSIVIGGQAASGLSVLDATTLKVQAPTPTALNVGRIVDVEVRTGYGTFVAQDAFQFAPHSTTPLIDTLAPATGTPAGGDVVEITGDKLYMLSGVKFGDSPAEVVAITEVPGAPVRYRMTVRTPAHPVAKVDLRITNGTASVVLADAFTYADGVTPLITAITPSTAGVLGGETIRVEGANFFAQELDAVVVNGTSVAFQRLSDTALDFVAPAASQGAGTVTVAVLTTHGTSNAVELGYLGPVMSGLAPTRGSMAGDTVTISGSGFVANATTVFFNRLEANIQSITDTSLVVKAPAVQTYGYADVRVVVGSAWGGMARAYIYESSTPPRIHSVSPNTGYVSGGETLRLQGSGLDFVTRVWIGTELLEGLELRHLDDRTIEVTAPRVDVVQTVNISSLDNVHAIQTLQSGYTYVAPPLTVASMAPNAGSRYGGTLVIVSGAYLDAIRAVQFGGADAYIVSKTSQTLSVTAPPSAVVGLVDVIAIDVAGAPVSLLLGRFDYLDPNASAATTFSPTVTDMQGGAFMRLGGVRLSRIASVEIGGEYADIQPGRSDVTMQVLIPTSPIGAGLVDVQTIDLNGSRRVVGQLEYTDSGMSVTSITPEFGTPQGGTLVTLHGMGLLKVTDVWFGSARGDVDTTTQMDSAVEVRTPASVAATVDVILGDGVHQTIVGTFTFTDLEADIHTMSPTIGPTRGGSRVVFTGTGLDKVQGVFFGGITAVIETATRTDQFLAVTAPAVQAEGEVDVAFDDGTVLEALKRFMYSDEPIVVHSFDPDRAPISGGTFVEFIGTGLHRVLSVRFGNEDAPILVASGGTNIVVRCPAIQTPGLTDIMMSDGVTETHVGQFFYLGSTNGPVAITTVAPPRGSVKGGTHVTISGFNLINVEHVTFAGKEATIAHRTDTSVRVIAPAAVAAGAVDIVVRDAVSGAFIHDGFTYEASSGSGGGLPSSAFTGAGVGGCSLVHGRWPTGTWTVVLLLLLAVKRRARSRP